MNIHKATAAPNAMKTRPAITATFIIDDSIERCVGGFLSMRLVSSEENFRTSKGDEESEMLRLFVAN